MDLFWAHFEFDLNITFLKGRKPIPWAFLILIFIIPSIQQNIGLLSIISFSIYSRPWEAEQQNKVPVLLAYKLKKYVAFQLVMSVTAKKKSGWWESVNDGVESSGRVRERERDWKREWLCKNYRIRMTKWYFFISLKVTLMVTRIAENWPLKLSFR